MPDYVGKYLIARPTLEYGFFSKSVIYIYEHTSNGTGGVALNRATDIYFSTICSQFGHTAQTQDPIVYQGGPVNPQSLVMLHSDDFVSTNTLDTHKGLNISSDALMVEKLSFTAWPRYFRLVTGISAWAPYQLQAEIHNNSWLVADLPRELVFSYDGDALWQNAVDHVGRSMFDEFF